MGFYLQVQGAKYGFGHSETSNTPPQAGLYMSSIASLLLKFSNYFFGSPLVRMSATYSVVGI